MIIRNYNTTKRFALMQPVCVRFQVVFLSIGP